MMAIAGGVALWWFATHQPSLSDARADLSGWQNAQQEQAAAQNQPDISCEGECEIALGDPALGDRPADEQQKSADASADPPELLDLYEQRMMAHWTQGIGVFTFIGLAVLVATLIEARSSGEKVANVTREIGQAQLRPHLVVRERVTGRIHIDNRRIARLKFMIPVTNVGKTPAYAPSIHFRLFFFDLGPREYTDQGVVLEEKFDGLGDLAPEGGVYELNRQVQIPVGEIEARKKIVGANNPSIGVTTHAHLEIILSAEDYTGAKTRPYAVFVETPQPFRTNSEGGTDLVFDHPDLIRPGAAGYPETKV